MLKIPQSSSRVTGSGSAKDQVDPAKVFGNKGIQVQSRTIVPDMAGIQYAGDKAMAGAVNDVMQDMTSVASEMKKRDDNLQFIEQQNKAKEESQKYRNELDRIRKQVGYEAENNGWTADQRDEEYHNRRTVTKDQYVTNNQFKNKQVQLNFESGLRMSDITDEVTQIKHISDTRLNAIKDTLDNQDTLYLETIGNTDNIMEVFSAVNSQNAIIEAHGRASVDYTDEMIEGRKVATLGKYVDTFLASQLMKSDFDTASSILENIPDEYAQYIDKAATLKKLRALDKEKAADIKAKQATVDTTYMGMFDLSLETGEGIPTEDHIINESGMTDGRKAQALHKLKAYKTRSVKIVEDSDYVEEMRQKDRGHFLGRTDKSTGMLIDNWFDNKKKAYEELFETNPMAGYVQMSKDIASVGVMPSEFRGRLTSLLNSEDQSQVMFGVAVLKTIEEESPQMVAQDFKRYEKEMIIADLVDSGVNAPDAQNIGTQFMLMDKDSKKAQMKEARKVVDDPDEDIMDAIEASSILDWDVFGTPTITSQLREDYKELFSTFMVAYQGNAEMAKNRAQKIISSTWGRTNLDGSDRMMKRAPEKVYGTGTGQDDWINDQFELDMLEVGLESDEVTIMINPNNKNSKFPTYHIWDNNQSMFIMTPNNTPLEWKPDKQLHYQMLQDAKKIERQIENDKKKKEAARVKNKMRRVKHSNAATTIGVRG